MSESPGPIVTISETLKASQVRDVLHHYGEALRLRRKGIDRLNVYPVPDGDTGTNMSLTVQSVMAELKNAVVDDMGSITKAISRGATMGARGNSGAILAQVLRGMAESLKEKTTVGPHEVADALERARSSAYEAVLKPVEGTILTVVTAAAVAARKSADEGHKLKEQLEHVSDAAADALARTPDLLPVLKQAGVVDAGGSGFLLFVDALRYVATGEPIPGALDGPDDEPDLANIEHHNIGELRYIGGLRYEVMFLLEGDDTRISEFRKAWGNVGDSIVVVGGDGIWNCHIHSDSIGDSIELALDYGRPRQIRVTDLMEQVGAENGAYHEPVETAVVAVVVGNGLERTYRSMGVQQIVAGGQSANPSVAELLAAVEAAPSENVVVLPNNKNVHAAAMQLDKLTPKSVSVVPTTSVVQGLSTLVSYDSSVALADNVAEMSAAAERCVCGEVTQAVRDAHSDAGAVKADDWIGIGPDGISVVAATLVDALRGIVETLTGDDHELLTVIEGQGSMPEATAALRDWIAQHREHIEVEVHSGGQPLYPYLIGVE